MGVSGQLSLHVSRAPACEQQVPRAPSARFGMTRILYTEEFILEDQVRQIRCWVSNEENITGSW